MALNLDKSMGLVSRALAVHEKSAELIANNLANADTPGFKARDVDFRAVLNGQASMQNNDFALERTNKNHMLVLVETDSNDMLYRSSSQPSLDGNTVDPDLEKAAFAENSMRYMATLTFVSKHLSDHMLAIKGSR